MKFLFKNKEYEIISQSKSEVDYFQSLGEKLIVHYVPYCMTKIDVTNLIGNTNASRKYIFSGGYSNRDYKMLIEAAKQLSYVNFVIVCSELNNVDDLLPENITLYKEISSIEFNKLMYGAFAVIIPLKEPTGSSGQMVALAAMQMGKCIIYTDYPVISQYFTQDSGIPMEGQSLNAAIKAIEYVWNADYKDIKEIGEKAAQQYNENFTLEKQNEQVLSILKSHLS